METLIHILVFLFLLLGNIVLWPVLFLFGRNELREWRRGEEQDSWAHDYDRPIGTLKDYAAADVQLTQTLFTGEFQKPGAGPLTKEALEQLRRRGV